MAILLPELGCVSFQRSLQGTDLPWGLPSYKGDRDAQYECPQAVEAVEELFMVPIHENWGDAEVKDLGKAIRKVHEVMCTQEAQMSAKAFARV